MKDYDEELQKLYIQIGVLIREGKLDPLLVISDFIYTLGMMRSYHFPTRRSEEKDGANG